MTLCAVCQRELTDGETACPEHGAQRAADPLIGGVLSGYTIESWLAEGATGVLYRARHETIQKPAVVKVVRRELIADRVAVARFEREAHAVAGIRHPHLIDIFDIGTTPDGRGYYVMELLEGRTLARRMAAERIPFAEFGPILRDACGAVEAAHAAGVIHRDLQPEDLFLVERAGEASFVKVCDFDVAKLASSSESTAGLTLASGSLGSPRYGAPELLTGAAADERTDVFALGVILYELAAGRPPWRGETTAALVQAKLRSDPPPFAPAELLPGSSIELEAVIRGAIARDPAARCGSARALREALERLIAAQAEERRTASRQATARATGATATVASGPPTSVDGPIPGAPTLADPPAPTLLSAGPPRRSRRVAVAIAALALGGGLAFGVRQILHRAPPPQPPPPPVAVQAPPDPAALRSQALIVIHGGFKDGDPSVRRQAIDALAGGRDPAHVSALQPLLADPDLQVRASAASALATLGSRSSAEVLRAALGKEPTVDVWIAEALLKLSAEPGRQRLLEMFKKGNDEARFGAALVLADSGDGAARKFIRQRLDAAQPHDPTTVSLLVRLAHGGDELARATLVERIDQGDERLQITVADSVARLGDDAGRARLKTIAAAKGTASVRAYRALAALDDQSGYDLFCRVLGDSRRPLDERLQSVQGVGFSGEKAALPLLAPVLGDPLLQLRLAAAGAVLAILGADPQLLAARSLDWATSSLADDSFALRQSAVAVLAEADPATAVPLLGKVVINDARFEVRRDAATSLGRTRSSGAVVFLGKALGDGRGEVRIAALRSLGKIGDRTSAPMVALHLEGAPAQEKVVAAGTLIRLGDKGRVSDLKLGLASRDAAVRRLAVEESAADPDTEREVVATALKDRAPEVRLAAAIQLARRGSKEGVAELQKALKSRHRTDSIAADAALDRLGVAPAAPVDRRAAFDASTPEERLAAVAAAEQLSPTRAASLLQRAARDPDAQVRFAAVAVAARLAQQPGGSAPMAALLRGASTDADPAVRARAGQALARLAPQKSAPTGRPRGDGEKPAEKVAQPVVVDAAVPPPPVAISAAATPSPPPEPPRPDPAVGPRVATPPVVKPIALDEGQLAMTSGEIALHKGRYDSAVKELLRAQKLNPKLPVFFSLGEAYRKLGDGETSPGRRKDYYRQAVRSYQKSRDRRAAAYASELSDRLK
ncbi:MAG: hypothetical protein EXR72_22720 [Myxococcales bacterium]|nr:hypothetical protein [Myxococcales bacterium]